MEFKLQVEEASQGIWKYHTYYPSVPKDFWLSLNEGNTKELEIEGIFFKREDQNPTGSLKDRGMAYEISKIYSQETKEVVISTSGNAGISISAYCKLARINAHIFVSPKINKTKLEKINTDNTNIHITNKPVSDSLKFAKENSFPHLRSSSSPDAHEGYKSLTFEIHQNLGRVTSIFLSISSGTALWGIIEGYKVLGYLPKIFAVQSTSVCPISSFFDRDYQKTNISLMEAIVAKVTPRKDALIASIKNSGGGGFVVSDEEITLADKWLEKHDIETSYEGAAALVGVWKAKNKVDIGDRPLCILTGTKY